MHHSFFSFSAMFAIVALGASHLCAADSSVAYADDFSTVKGYRVTNTNIATGESSGAKTREIFIFMSESIVGGKLLITALEDNETAGPDGKPGVLSLRYDKLPISADYSGFVYQGRTENPIRLPALDGNVSAKQLKQVKVSFRYKAVNENQAHVGADYNCRFEADVENPYEYRVDFGVLKATGQWKEFDKTLIQGSNTNEFLKAVNGSSGAALKLVWGQEGEISSYDDGDTLLIDDVQITVTK